MPCRYFSITTRSQVLKPALSDTPRGLVSQAVAYGVIDPEDRATLLRFLQVYDEAAPGKAEMIDSDLLQKVGFFAERTLDEMGQH